MHCGNLVCDGIDTRVLLSQALEMRYGWSLGAVELCQSHCLRGRIFSSMGMPTSAFVEYIRASQVCSSSLSTIIKLSISCCLYIKHAVISKGAGGTAARDGAFEGDEATPVPDAMHCPLSSLQALGQVIETYACQRKRLIMQTLISRLILLPDGPLVRLVGWGFVFATNACLQQNILHCSRLTNKSSKQECKCVQADVEGLGCVEVAAQLAEWGLTTHMHNFGEQCQAAFGAQHAGWRHMAHADCLSSWNTAAVAIQNVRLFLTLVLKLPFSMHSSYIFLLPIADLHVFSVLECFAAVWNVHLGHELGSVIAHKPAYSSAVCQ